MQVTYKCKKCEKEFTEDMRLPLMEVSCKCGGSAIKTFKGLSLDKEDDTVSHAIETMKWATNPSGKQKTVI